MAETVSEEIARLRREIGERQSRLQFLVLGDPRIGVHFCPTPSPTNGCGLCKQFPCMCAVSAVNPLTSNVVDV